MITQNFNETTEEYNLYVYCKRTSKCFATH